MKFWFIHDLICNTAVSRKNITKYCSLFSLYAILDPEANVCLSVNVVGSACWVKCHDYELSKTIEMCNFDKYWTEQWPTSESALWCIQSGLLHSGLSRALKCNSCCTMCEIRIVHAVVYKSLSTLLWSIVRNKTNTTRGESNLNILTGMAYIGSVTSLSHSHCAIWFRAADDTLASRFYCSNVIAIPDWCKR